MLKSSIDRNWCARPGESRDKSSLLFSFLVCSYDRTVTLAVVDLIRNFFLPKCVIPKNRGASTARDAC